MASDSLAYVLGLLRRLKATPNVGIGQPSIGFVREWVGSHDSLAAAKLIIAIQENLVAAHQLISMSTLSDEARAGLLETIGSLRASFAFENLNNSVSSYITTIDSALTNFAIITSAINIQFPPDAENEIGSLISDLGAFAEKLDNFDVPENVRETAKRHLSLLVALLINAQAVGINPAISAYYDMILALKKEHASESEAGDSKGFWSNIKSWNIRFEAIYNLIDRGSKLIPYLDDIPRIGGF